MQTEFYCCSVNYQDLVTFLFKEIGGIVNLSIKLNEEKKNLKKLMNFLSFLKWMQIFEHVNKILINCFYLFYNRLGQISKPFYLRTNEIISFTICNYFLYNVQTENY